MNKKISGSMKKALLRFGEIKEGTAYTLKIGFPTLDALESRGLIKHMNPDAVGQFYSPHTTKRYKLTNEGEVILDFLYMGG